MNYQVPELPGNHRTIDLSVHNFNQFDLGNLVQSELIIAKLTSTPYKNTRETFTKLIREGQGIVTIDKNHQPLALSILFVVKTKLGPSFMLNFYGSDTDMLKMHICKSLSHMKLVTGTPRFGLNIRCPVDINYKSVLVYLLDVIGLSYHGKWDINLTVVCEEKL